MLPTPFSVKPVVELSWVSPGRKPIARPAAMPRPFEPGVLVETHQDGPSSEKEVFHADGGKARLAANGSCSDRAFLIAEWLRAAAAPRSPIGRMQAVIGMAMETGPWTAGSITVPDSTPRMRSVAYLDARAADCDRLQGEIGEGPAHDAIKSGKVQAATNLAMDDRWPRWATAANQLGISRVLVLRLFANSTSGTLSLYATRPGQISGAMVRDAEVLAAHASMLLDAIVTEDQLRQAAYIRGLIGQAQGILMHKYGINADAAFAVLRRISQQHNIKIVTIAEQLIATGTLPGFDHPRRAKMTTQRSRAADSPVAMPGRRAASEG